jgi:hypothetical protein
MKGVDWKDKNSKNHKSDKNNEKLIRVELKYCERCGSLWLRECGAGVVYCSNCQPEVAELPLPKKKPQRVKVPVRRHAVVEDYRAASLDDDVSQGLDLGLDQNMDLDNSDFEAAGGVA